MWWAALAVWAIGGTIVLYGMTSGDGGEDTVHDGKKSTGKGSQRIELQAWARRAEVALGWSGLAAFLDVVALGESGWKLRPRGETTSAGSNKAVGPYQIRPKSAGRNAEERAMFLADPSLLQNAATATAAIVAYLVSLRGYNSNPSWVDLRVGMAFPVFTKGYPKKLIEGLAKVTKYKTLASQQERYMDGVRRFEKNMGRSGHKFDINAKTKLPPRISDVMDFEALLREQL